MTTELDVDRGELTEALRAFTRRSAGADVSLVFYAGHGLEMDGTNYLVPVDARLERDVDVRYETVTLDDLLVSTVGARLRLVILDACRNNPRPKSNTRAIREAYAARFGDDVEAMVRDIRARQKASGREYVRLAARRTNWRRKLRDLAAHGSAFVSGESAERRSEPPGGRPELPGAGRESGEGSCSRLTTN